jgi:hypothetical protein
MPGCLDASSALAAGVFAFFLIPGRDIAADFGAEEDLRDVFLGESEREDSLFAEALPGVERRCI